MKTETQSASTRTLRGMTRQRLGRDGEEWAVGVLRSRGYLILARNWRGNEGELDLICVEGGAVVAVEVKTRRSNSFGHPAEAVTPNKLRRIERLLLSWVRTQRPSWLRARRRVDVVALTLETPTGSVIELRRDVGHG
ncbi:MAG: YraN family protein [Micrococcaceae bacterium]